MHVTRIRVRFDEVDTMGVVHHPRYLVYFEVARTEYFRALGIVYRDVMAAGTHLAVAEAGARYLRPARYDDALDVETRCTESRGASVLLEYVVRRGDEVLATGFSRHAAVDDAGRAKRIPPEVRERFEGAVEPAVELPGSRGGERGGAPGAAPRRRGAAEARETSGVEGEA